MKNEKCLEDFDYIISEETKESNQPFLQLEIPRPRHYKKSKEYIEEPKRVIIIEL